MTNTDIRTTTTTDMTNAVDDFEVTAGTIDESSVHGETFWDSLHWKEYVGYYKTIPELKKAVDALAD